MKNSVEMAPLCHYASPVIYHFKLFTSIIVQSSCKHGSSGNNSFVMQQPLSRSASSFSFSAFGLSFSCLLQVNLQILGPVPSLETVVGPNLIKNSFVLIQYYLSKQTGVPDKEQFGSNSVVSLLAKG